jgi:N-acetylglucosamine-6-phosphate deacetylase
MKALINGCVLTPDGFKQHQSVLYRNGVIVDVCADQDRPSDIAVERDLDGMTLLPGFIDVQVNGGGDVLFNEQPTVSGIKVMGEAHRKFGTTGFFPTLISDNYDVMAQAIDAVDAAIVQNVPGVLGIHLEGPFLNAGKKGVHDADKFSQIGQDEIELLCRLKHGITIVTLAPEMTTPDIIRTLRARGVIVSAGHTLASYEETHAAMDAGLTGFTHLFNAMKPLDSRTPGVIAAALEDARAWCGVIVDGHHVHPAMLRLALRAKVGDQIFLVTDAMPSVGGTLSTFSLNGLPIDVKDGKCLTAEGTLAGSNLDMISAVRNAVDMLDVDLARAAHMASTLPAHFIHADDKLGAIRTGQQADFVLLSPELDVIETWIQGHASSPLSGAA